MSGPGVALTTPALPTTWLRGSEMPKGTPGRAPCSIDGCDKPAHSHGWCKIHYQRWQRQGTTDIVGRQRPSVETRFWQHVVKGEGCWEWNGGSHPGYGSFRVDGRHRPAHRFSWELHNGPILHGLHVCHHCDNPPCVRPDHLFLGTMQDNIRDAAAKGRLSQKSKGRRLGPSPLRQLNDGQVEYVRGALALGARQIDLAVRFGVHRTVINRLKRGLTYVPMPDALAEALPNDLTWSAKPNPGLSHRSASEETKVPCTCEFASGGNGVVLGNDGRLEPAEGCPRHGKPNV